MVSESAMICTTDQRMLNTKQTSGARSSSVGLMAQKSRSKKSEADRATELMRGSSNWLRPQTYTLVALDLGKM